MKSYSLDLRSKLVTAHICEKLSIRKVAVRFGVTKSLVQKLVKQQQTEGNLFAKKRGKPRLSPLTNAEAQVRELVAEYPDAGTDRVQKLRAQYWEKIKHIINWSRLCQ